MDAPEPTGRFGALVQLLSPRRRRASGSEDVPAGKQPAHHDSDNTNPVMQDIPSAGGSPTFAPPSARDNTALPQPSPGRMASLPAAYQACVSSLEPQIDTCATMCDPASCVTTCT